MADHGLPQRNEAGSQTPATCVPISVLTRTLRGALELPYRSLSDDAGRMVANYGSEDLYGSEHAKATSQALPAGLDSLLDFLG